MYTTEQNRLWTIYTPMYTTEQNMFNRLWTIYTPEDEIICSVETQTEAEILLSHLNRFS